MTQIRTTTDRYINPYTDFGFKRIFGIEANKDLLIDFLNTLISEHGKIISIQYLNSEQTKRSKLDRNAIFDIYCKTERNEYFIVEMQKAKQNYFKDRSVYYSTFPIQSQAKQGEWDFQLNAVYFVGILDFVFDEDKEDTECFHHEVKLIDTKTNKIFYDKLTYIYLEMPKFNKTEEQLETLFDKWLFVLKFLPRLQDRPVKLQERIFKELFDIAEMAKFTPQEAADYEESLKIYRDMKNVIDTAIADARRDMENMIDTARTEALVEGRAKGRAEGELVGEARGRQEGELAGEARKAQEIARNLKSQGVSVSVIIAATGLSAEEIEVL